MLALAVVAAACSGESGTEGPKAGEPAGEVIEITGAPAVERGGERVALAVGDKVFGTDTVDTGDDGSVTIRLFHNEARWTLAAGKKKRIDSSVAWRAPKTAAGGLLASDDQRESTAAAGRHAEKEAAETRDTASLVPGSAAPADESAPEPAAPAPQPAATAAPPPPPPPAPAKRAPAPKRKRSSGSSSKSSKKSSDKFGHGGLGIEGTGRGGGGTGTGTIGIGTTGTIGKGGGGGGAGYGSGSGSLGERKAKAPKIRPGSATVSGSLDKEIIRRVIRQHQAQLRYCYDRELKKDPDAKGLVKVSFVIGADGAVTSATATATGGAPMESAARCVEAKLKAMKFPAPKGGGTVKVSYPFTFSPG